MRLNQSFLTNSKRIDIENDSDTQKTVPNKIKYMIMMHGEIQKQAQALQDLKDLFTSLKIPNTNEMSTSSISSSEVDQSSFSSKNAKYIEQDKQETESGVNSNGDKPAPTEVNHKFQPIVEKLQSSQILNNDI